MKYHGYTVYPSYFGDDEIISNMTGWWFQTCFYFPFHICDVILPIDFHSIIFQDGEIAPPTRKIY